MPGAAWLLLILLLVALVVLIIVILQKPDSTRAITAALNAVGDLSAVRTQVQTIAAAQTQLQQAVATLESATREIGTRVTEASGAVKDDLGREIREARGVVEQIRTDYEARRKMEDELRSAALRIEAVLVGPQTRGEAGEQILSAAFKQFPPGMIDQDFRVNGKPVEYALVLPNGRRLAIDSKWSGAIQLQRLATLAPGAEREGVADEIERTLQRRVREVAQYIDPSSTLTWAVAAVPDAAYAVCNKAHVEGYRAGVILIPYSLVVPYVLTLYRMNLQYAQAVDSERLEGALSQMERILDNLDRVLENSVAKAATMLQNAYSECRRSFGDLRGAVAALRTAPSEGKGSPISTTEADASIQT